MPNPLGPYSGSQDKEEDQMAKDSQMDPKETLKAKAKGQKTMADDETDGEGRNNKKQSGNRSKPGNDK